MEHKLEISENYNSTRTIFSYQIGSFKVVKNLNKTLNTAQVKTTVLTSTDIKDKFKDGYFIWVDDVIEYIVLSVKVIQLKQTPYLCEVYLELISLSYILQRIIMPNKSITQPVDDTLPMKTVKVAINELMELYFSQYRDYTNWVNDYMNDVDIADEYVWTQPTLFEAICDLAQDSNTIPYLTFDVDTFHLRFINIHEVTEGQMDLSFVNGLEESMSLENNPQRMVNIITNNISQSAIKQKNIYQTSAIGVFDNLDPSARVLTSYNINKPTRVIVKANLSDLTNNIDGGITIGHPAGFFEIDITEFVYEKTYFDMLTIKSTTWSVDSVTPEYRNCALFYEKDKNYIGGMLLNQTKNIFGSTDNLNLTNLVRYIMNHRIDLVLQFPTGTFDFYYFNVDEAGSFVFDVEYITMDNLRYDIIKESGYGSIVQNQNDAFINFFHYRKQQVDLMNRLGQQEIVLMGKTDNLNNLPKIGMGYFDKLVVQTTYIPFEHHINFMVIATSLFNRVDGDAVINTKKRFWEIIPASESIERNEFYTQEVSSTVFNNIINNANYFYLMTLKGSNQIVKNFFLPFLKQKIDDDNYIFSAKTLDNRFAGFYIDDDAGTRYIKGAEYTQPDGSAWGFNIAFTNVTDNDLAKWKLFPIGYSVTHSLITTIFNKFKYKDNREKMAFSILLKRV